MSVLRSWMCLNPRCDSGGAGFDAWEHNPPCPTCGNVRVQWVPGGGHVGKVAGGIDADFRGLADMAGLTNLNSARRGEAAKITASPAPFDGRAQPAMTFAPGFSASVPLDVPRCVPSAQPVNFKAKVTAGTALSPNRSFPGMGSHTQIEARHSGKS